MVENIKEEAADYMAALRKGGDLPAGLLDTLEMVLWHGIRIGTKHSHIAAMEGLNKITKPIKKALSEGG